MAFGCDPFPPSQFGTITLTGTTSGGPVSPDANGNITLGGGNVAVVGIPGTTSGGPVSPDANGNITLGGGNVAVVGIPETNTLVFSAPGATGITWVDVTSSPIQMAVNTGYIDHFGGSTQYILPVTSVLGDVLFVVTAGTGNSGWVLNMAPSQQVYLGSDQSAFGGTITSLNAGDSLYLVCTQANVRWIAIAFIGNFNVM